jgi:zinc transport system substrate-binding protein
MSDELFYRAKESKRFAATYLQAALILSVVVAILGSDAVLFAEEPLDVFAGIPPAAFLAKRIGGDRVKVESLISSNQDPHSFEPASKQIQSLGKAKLFFEVGLPFEIRLVEKIEKTHPSMKIIDVSKGIEKRRLSSTGGNAADHRDADQHAADHHDADASAMPHEHEESPEDLDPHVWLSPPLVKIMAGNVAQALEQAEPDHAAVFKANLARLDEELDALDAKIRKALKPYAGRSFFVFHPAFGYFGDCYGLHQEAVEAGGKQPSPRQLRDLIHKAKDDRVRMIFVQPQFDPRSAQAVAESIGATVVAMNDLEEDVLDNLNEIGEKIEKALK